MIGGAVILNPSDEIKLAIMILRDEEVRARNEWLHDESATDEDWDRAYAYSDGIAFARKLLGDSATPKDGMAPG